MSESRNQMKTIHLGPYQELVDNALEETEQKEILARIWRADHTVWKPDPTEITNRLGWLHIHEDLRDHIPQLESFVYAVQKAGYTHALLLGMGGSSLAPDLFSKTFSKPDQDNRPFLKLDVLDSTDPGAVFNYSERLDPAKALFIVSTKSGTTEETLSFFKYFYNWTADALGESAAGDHFIAITDPGTKLVDLARGYHFRATFLNDPNIGGRYSALSYFGLVPAALIGIDLRLLLERASQMAAACKPAIEAKNCPAASLGVTLGELAKAGRDKVTLFLSSQIASFGDWVEQLIAESTGKDRRGILPVVGESIGTPGSYSNDRVFVLIQISGDTSFSEEISALEAAGHPVIRLSLGDLYDIGGQFFLWELAIAFAGYRLGIQPFDQPNVESAKALARQRVTAYKQTGQLPIPDPSSEAGGIAVYGQVSGNTPGEALPDFLANAKPGDYIAIQAFLKPGPATDQALRRLRAHLKQSTRLATTLGYGPRFLHSTGQLHKGDAGNGLFIQFTADDPRDIPIPDQAGSPESSISFGVLKMAQALGDYQALLDAGRRAIRFHFKGDSAQKINLLADSIEAG